MGRMEREGEVVKSGRMGEVGKNERMGEARKSGRMGEVEMWERGMCDGDSGELVRCSVSVEDLLHPFAGVSLLSRNLCQLLLDRH